MLHVTAGSSGAGPRPLADMAAVSPCVFADMSCSSLWPPPPSPLWAGPQRSAERTSRTAISRPPPTVPVAIATQTMVGRPHGAPLERGNAGPPRGGRLSVATQPECRARGGVRGLGDLFDRRLVPQPHVHDAVHSGRSPMSAATAVAPVTTSSVLHFRYAAFEACFTPEPISVGHSRHTTSVFLRRCGIAESLTDSVMLCISELVTNGITHGSGDVSLRVRCLESEIRVEVTDASSAPATRRSAGVSATSGRGLILVEALSADWGISKGGRTTWCTFRIPPGRPCAPVTGTQAATDLQGPDVAARLAAPHH